MARRKRPDIPGHLSCDDVAQPVVAARSGNGQRPVALLPPREGVLRNRVRTGTPARLAAGRAERCAACVRGRFTRMTELSSEAYAILRGRHSDPFRYL